MPSHFERFHAPALRSAFACGTLRACASNSAYLADLNAAVPRPLDACKAVVPAPVMRKIEDRIAVALRTQ